MEVSSKRIKFRPITIVIESENELRALYNLLSTEEEETIWTSNFGTAVELTRNLIRELRELANEMGINLEEK